MPPSDRPYSRVYWEAPDDPKFAAVWRSDPVLGLWLRLLVAADIAYPQAAYLPVGVRKASLRVLVEAKLVDLTADGRYRLHGLAAERERRSDAARRAGQASGRARHVNGVERPSNGR